MRKRKFAFEIYWPLVGYATTVSLPPHPVKTDAILVGSCARIFCLYVLLSMVPHWKHAYYFYPPLDGKKTGFHLMKIAACAMAKKV